MRNFLTLKLFKVVLKSVDQDIKIEDEMASLKNRIFFWSLLLPRPFKLSLNKLKAIAILIFNTYLYHRIHELKVELRHNIKNFK